ncbi:hypothetical protein C0993_003792, partial [Termitomyces sp. T159_Od127]
SGQETRPPKPPTKFPDLMAMPCTGDDKYSDPPFKEGNNLMKAMQTKEFLTWEHTHEKYECWLIKDDFAIGLI